jgi:hypothetical protein
VAGGVGSGNDLCRRRRRRRSCLVVKKSLICFFFSFSLLFFEGLFRFYFFRHGPKREKDREDIRMLKF